MSDLKDDRRRGGRLARVSLVQANSFVIGRTVNLSAGGARIEVYQRLPLQSPVSLDLLLGEHLVEVSARVVYVTEVGTDRYFVGLQFEGVDSTTRLLLDDFLEEPFDSAKAIFRIEEEG